MQVYLQRFIYKEGRAQFGLHLLISTQLYEIANKFHQPFNIKYIIPIES